MNGLVWIEVELKQKNRFLLKCFKNRISVYDTMEDGESLFVKILEKDYKKVQKFWFVHVKKKGTTGILKIKENLKKYHVIFLCLFCFVPTLYFFSHMIVSVEVIHSNQDIRELVLNALEDYGVKKNTWRKEYQELEKIKNSILDRYPESLEWMEIETHGMKYEIRVEERKLEQKEEEKTSCNLVATKDGIIKDMIFQKGEALVKVNDSVKKGDILVSGIIKKEEEEKNVVCATGKVYAEVWYEVSASVPLEYEISEKTGKKRWNFRFQNSYINDFIFRSRLEHFEENKKELFDFFGQRLYFVVQEETNVIKKKYTEEEALELGLEEVTNKINDTLKEKESILLKKVLKKEINNSTMNIEVFVAVKEMISEVQEFLKIEEE